MAKITIDLCARYAPHERKIWRIFPGNKYTFLSAFVSESLVFLDSPGLILPAGDLDAPGALLNQRIHMYAAVRDWAVKRRRALRREREKYLLNPVRARIFRVESSDGLMGADATTCGGSDDRAEAGEQVWSPVGAQAAGDLAVGCGGAEFAFTAVVVGADLG